MSEPQAEPKKTGWEDWATRTTAILAVIAALSSGRWGASNLQAILEQGKVNDTWAYYQAKSLKQHDAEQISSLANALASGQTPDKAAALLDLKKKLDSDAKREEAEKNQRQTDARSFEVRRDKLVESSFWFELSFAGLQLGVILCTIAAGAKHKTPWVVGIVVGLLGLVMLLNGVFHFHRAPKQWYQGTSQDMGYEAPSPQSS